jgi:hypothetical protein
LHLTRFVSFPPSAAAAHGGLFLIRAIKRACDHVTIEEVLANVSSMTQDSENIKGQALLCFNLPTHGEVAAAVGC